MKALFGFITQEFLMGILQNVLAFIVAGIVLLLLWKLLKPTKKNQDIGQLMSERKRSVYLPLKRELYDIHETSYGDGLKLKAKNLETLIVDGDEKVINNELYKMALKLESEIKAFNALDIIPLASELLKNHFKEKYIAFMGSDRETFEITNHDTGEVNIIEKEAKMITAFTNYVDEHPDFVAQLLKSKVDSQQVLAQVLEELNIDLDEFETYESEIEDYLDQEELTNTEYLFHEFDLKKALSQSCELKSKQEQFIVLQQDVDQLMALLTQAIEKITAEYEI